MPLFRKGPPKGGPFFVGPRKHSMVVTYHTRERPLRRNRCRRFPKNKHLYRILFFYLGIILYIWTMTQIQAFVGRTTHELTERVNEWLLANERDIVLLNFLHGNASNDLSLIIVYSKNDSILQEIKSK